MKTMKLKILPAALLSLSLVVSTLAFAEDTAVQPAEAEPQSEATESVQTQVDAKAADQAAEKRANYRRCAGRSERDPEGLDVAR